MNVFEGKVARCAASLKCAVMLVARIGSVLSQIAELSELVRVEQTHPWWGRRLARRLRPLAGLTGRRVPCFQNPIKKSELEVCAKTSCKLHSLRPVDAQLSRGAGPVIAAPVRAESPLPNAAAAPKTTRAPKGKKSACRSDVELRRVRSDYKRTAATQRWPASARPAPTPGRRSRAYKIL